MLRAHEEACRSANDAWRTLTHLDGRSDQDPAQPFCLPMSQDPRSTCEISPRLVRAAAEREAPGLRAAGKKRKIGKTFITIYQILSWLESIADARSPDRLWSCEGTTDRRALDPR